MDLSFPDPIALALMLVIFYTAALVVICSLLAFILNKFTRSKRAIDIMTLLKQGLTGLIMSISTAVLIWLIKITLFETIDFSYTTDLAIDIASVLLICIPMIAVSIAIGMNMSRQYRR